MPRFVVEREVPWAGEMSDEQLKGTCLTSCEVLRSLGPDIQWVESYVTGDKIYCIYLAPDEQMIRRHAEQAGLPADQVNRVTRVIDPTVTE